MRHAQDPSQKSGFTIVELMVVVVILGLTISITAVNWQKVVPRAQLNSAVRTISNVLNSTRSEAISRNAEFRIFYDIENQSYWVETPYKKEGGLALQRVPGEEDPEEGQRLINDFTELEDGVTFSQIHIDGEVYSDGVVFVRFSPVGASSEHTIELFHAKTDTAYTIEVLALSGLIRFHKDAFVREPVQESDFE